MKGVEEIHTSLHLQLTNTDYKLVIRFPSIEYCIPSKNFSFIKTLSKYETNEFFEARFQEWQLKAIDVLLGASHFQDYLGMLEKASNAHMSLTQRKALINQIAKTK